MLSSCVSVVEANEDQQRDTLIANTAEEISTERTILNTSVLTQSCENSTDKIDEEQSLLDEIPKDNDAKTEGSVDENVNCVQDLTHSTRNVKGRKRNYGKLDEFARLRVFEIYYNF